MSSKNICEMLSIKALLSNDQYLIPLYQRNYAWQEAHLRQLIQDVWDSRESNRDYYIGTLVTYQRADGTYETVDGQQRLTTLTIIMCAIQHEMSTTVDTSWYRDINLSYEFRKESTDTLKALFNHSSVEDMRDNAIYKMYENVRSTIESIVTDNTYLDRFLEYLFEHVIITRVILPADSDLNYYFEIMNNRGEQLQKHEILKALFMRHSQDDPFKNWMIGQIWEACADMDRYLPLNFTPTIRKIIFKDKLNDFQWESLDELINQIHSKVNQTTKEEQFSIRDALITDDSISLPNSDKEGDRFESVIQFPGFLLQVLRVITEEDIPLDDKKLLTTFNDYLNESSFADEFILNMLKLRFLFDRFVIKRDYIEDKVNGKIRLLSLSKQGDSFDYNNTYTDSSENQRVIMVESMFHVSLPSQNYKHWLTAVLKYVNANPDGKGLGIHLEQLAKTYMFGRFIRKEYEEGFYYRAIFKDEITSNLPSRWDFPTYKEHIDLFIFNYIDYCIWQKQKKKEDFEFTSRTSIEHFYPQHPLPGYPDLDEESLHDIGNLCLISRSKNSELSNYSPVAKTEHYQKSGIDSLKQKMMMDIVNVNKRKSSITEKIWWRDEIIKHHEAIKQLVTDSFNTLGKS
jgi:hypothetical protein